MELVALSTTAIIGITYFIVAVIALHLLRPDYNPMQRVLSEFAVGKHGWLMASAFIALATGSFCLALGIKQTFSMTSFVLLVVWSAGIFVDSIFKTDLMGGEDTKSGLIHVLAAFLSFLAIIAASFVLSREFLLNTQWMNIYPISLIHAVIITIAFIFSIYTLFMKPKFAGLVQRVFIAFVLSWLFIVSFNLFSIA